MPVIEFVQAAIPDLVIMISLGLLGALLSRAILTEGTVSEILSLAFPVGAGALGFLLFLLSWAGVPLSPTIILLTGLVTAGFGILLLSERQSGVAFTSRIFGRFANRISGITRSSVRSAVPLVIFAGLIAIGSYIAVGLSHSNWDTAAVWVIKGYGIAAEGSIFAGERWGAHGLSYPLNIPMLVSVMTFIGGDSLPGTKLIYVAYFFSVLLGCYGYWRRNGLEPWSAGVGLLLLATVPLLYRHSTIGFPNLPMASYLVLGVLVGLQGAYAGKDRHLIMAGILLGLAAWTNLDGILFVTAAVAAILLTGRLVARPVDVRWRFLIGPIVLIVGIWLLFYWSYGRQSQAMSAVASLRTSFAVGEYNLVELRQIIGYMLRSIFQPGLWGLLFPVGGAILIIRWRSWAGREHSQPVTLVALVASTGLVTALSIYLKTFALGDMYGWIGGAFPRSFLTTAILFGILAVRSLGQIPTRSTGANQIADGGGHTETA